MPSLYFAVPGIQCLYAHGLTSGLVLDSGTCITSAIPVIDGFCVKHAVCITQSVVSSPPYGVPSAFGK